jgi:hypothetical protein
MLDRNSIISIDDRKTISIDIPEWGGNVLIRKWSGKDRAVFVAKSIKADNSGAEINWDTLYNNFALAVALSLCDENGDRLFTSEQADIDILASKDGAVIQKIYQEALVLNGLAKKSIEDAAKNFNAIQSEESISGSQEN